MPKNNKKITNNCFIKKFQFIETTSNDALPSVDKSNVSDNFQSKTSKKTCLNSNMNLEVEEIETEAPKIGL